MADEGRVMAHLELRVEGDQQRVVPLTGDLLVGRDPDCDLQIDHSRISRRHARFARAGDSWRVEDLGSKNGVVVDGDRVERATLDEGSVVVIGPVELRFRASSIEHRHEHRLDVTALDQTLAERPSGREVRRRLELLLQLATVLDDLEATGELIERLGAMICQLHGASRCLLEVGGERFTHGQGHAAEETAFSRTVLQGVREHAEAVLINDLFSGADLAEAHSARMLGIRSAMAAPIPLPDEPHGLLYVDRRASSSSPYGKDDLLLLACVARLAGTAIASSRRASRHAALARRGDDGAAASLIGDSDPIRELRETITQRVGPVKAPVLLTGETGTGKGLVAEILHRASPRTDGPFVGVNCAAIPRELVESELFGHEKGSFTGADRRKLGLVEVASGGTLFLDEVGELDPAVQAKLLTALQDQRLTRVGGTSPVPFDVRVLAATNRDLEAEVEEGRFRRDLYYRLNVVKLRIPPLRERTGDVALLAGHFLTHACREMDKPCTGFAADALTAMARYSWPGNVRELANCVERALIFADAGGSLEALHLPEEVRDLASEAVVVLDPVEEVERQLVARALQDAGGNKRAAARALGWYPQKLYSRLQRYGLE
jgi:transcriptional regulator with GAF, ATPase, and Fis domain